MPLAAEYREQINSQIADLANLGAPGGGGSAAGRELPSHLGSAPARSTARQPAPLSRTH